MSQHRSVVNTLVLIFNPLLKIFSKTQAFILSQLSVKIVKAFLQVQTN